VKWLNIFIASIAMAGPGYSAGKFVPPDGKVLLIVGQDVDN